jgi:hypothetical protein
MAFNSPRTRWAMGNNYQPRTRAEKLRTKASVLFNILLLARDQKNVMAINKAAVQLADLGVHVRLTRCGGGGCCR